MFKVYFQKQKIQCFLCCCLRLNCFCIDIIIERRWWCNISVCTTPKYLLFQMTMTIYHMDPYLLNISVYELSIFLRLSFLCSKHLSSSMLFASSIPLRQAPITYISVINSTKHRVVRVGHLADWHYKERPHVISLMKKHENNLRSFKKFAAVFSVEFRSLGRPEDRRTSESSWNMLLPGSSSIILWDCHLFGY